MSTGGNVLKFPEAGRGDGATEGAGRVLNDCRDFALRRLRATVRGWLSEIEEELMQLADAELDRDTQRQYQDARSRTRAAWSSVEAAFVSRLSEAVDARLKGEGHLFDPIRTATNPLELKLVEEDELTQDITVSEIAGSIREACEEDLYALSRRLGSLLGSADDEDLDNPFGPDVVCDALRAACEEIEVAVQLRVVLLRLLQKRISQELGALYADLNSRLVDYNILPQLRRSYRKQVTPGAARPTPTTQGGEAPAAAAPAAPRFEFPAEAGQDMYALLQRLLAGGVPVAPAGGMPAAGGTVPVEGMSGPVGSGAASLPPESWASLNALQQIGSTDPMSVAVSPKLLHDLRASPVVQHFSPVDTLTVDIVAMLFDFIFDDEQIPDPIKAVVGRLQIPVLKVAMLDKSFFSTKAHPARRLLDALSRAAVSLAAGVSHDDPMYCQIAALVGRVQDEFDRDIGVFDKVLEEFETWLSVRERREADTAACSARLVAAREEAEAAARQAVAVRLEAGTPEVVRHFLETCWVGVLAEMATGSGEGEGGAAWRGGLQTASDLVWSVTPKAGTEARGRLVAMLPGLVKRLREGMLLAGIPDAEAAGFNDKLMRLHSAAIRQQPLPKIEVEHAVADTDAAPAFVHRERSAGDVVLDSIRLVAPAAPEQALERVLDLQRGDWLEFVHDNGERVRARLSWVSPQRGIYLFTSPHSPRAMAIAPAALEAQLAQGLASRVDRAPLFERAVERALESLKAA